MSAVVAGQNKNTPNNKKPTTFFEALDRFGQANDFEPAVTAAAKANFHPTSAPPGSWEKIEVLRERVEKGQPLWHDDDRTDFRGVTPPLNGRARAEYHRKHIGKTEDTALPKTPTTNEGKRRGRKPNSSPPASKEIEVTVTDPFKELSTPAQPEEARCESSPHPQSSDQEAESADLATGATSTPPVTLAEPAVMTSPVSSVAPATPQQSVASLPSLTEEQTKVLELLASLKLAVASNWILPDELRRFKDQHKELLRAVAPSELTV